MARPSPSLRRRVSMSTCGSSVVTSKRPTLPPTTMTQRGSSPPSNKPRPCGAVNRSPTSTSMANCPQRLAKYAGRSPTPYCASVNCSSSPEGSATPRRGPSASNGFHHSTSGRIAWPLLPNCSAVINQPSAWRWAKHGRCSRRSASSRSRGLECCSGRPKISSNATDRQPDRCTEVHLSSDASDEALTRLCERPSASEGAASDGLRGRGTQ